jgi:hypothetical protein
MDGSPSLVSAVLVWFILGLVWITSTADCMGGSLLYNAARGFALAYVLLPFSIASLACAGCCCVLAGSAPPVPAEDLEVAAAAAPGTADA